LVALLEDIMSDSCAARAVQLRALSACFEAMADTESDRRSMRKLRRTASEPAGAAGDPPADCDRCAADDAVWADGQPAAAAPA
jgi:hypothetical protein